MVEESIKGSSQSVKHFLQLHEYVIPEYQRPYSWTKDKCSQLFDDLYDYYISCDGKRKPSSPYFLGTVVLHPEKPKNPDSRRVVIDGQQRLITLSLLVKGLFASCATYKVLEKMIYKVSPVTDDAIPGKIKIEHRVLEGQEAKQLESIIISGDSETNSRYKENYEVFLQKINDLEGFNAKKLKNFIDIILGNTRILPIKCGDDDLALTVFETINDRGMPLTDADIFKAVLYKRALNKKKHEEFNSRWTEVEDLTNKSQYFSLKEVFTDYMHVRRGDRGETGPVVGIRKFFTGGGKSILKTVDWNEITTSIEKIVWSWKYLTEKSYKADSETINWARVLIQSPNQYWEYPIMTFMHKNIEGANVDDFKISKKNATELKKLLRTTARFCYLRWLKDRTVNSLKTPTFKCVANIAKGKDYHSELQKNLEGITKDDLKLIVEEESRGLPSGVCYLLAVLNPRQNNLIPTGEVLNIEHILPKKWNKYRYDTWEGQYPKEIMDKIGNRVLLERDYNIRAGNDYFEEKIKSYNKSEISEVHDVAKFKKWTPKEYKSRTDQIHKTLKLFFFSKK